MTPSKNLPPLDWNRVNTLIAMALTEDVGDGDATSLAVIPAGTRAAAKFVTRQECVCAGLEVAAAVFKALDPGSRWTPNAADGDKLPPDAVMASVKGDARALLTGERSALNFLQRLCGVATTASRYAAACSGKTVVLDTRKTTPGWRNLEKYAVAAGGASNHRVGLHDRIMVKDNHRFLAGLEGKGAIARSVERSRAAYPTLEVEVEADTLDEVAEAVAAKADYILLDNMGNAQMAEAVKINRGVAKLEASGNITLERIPSICALGVDFISCGALTHSVKAVDISMETTLED